MELTVDQAAAKLGMTERQVRYLIKRGSLAARKRGKRWLIDSDALPRSKGQQEAEDARNANCA
ncbi:MAG: helix-turn-helix domain-containing protein [Proteobacteria bacterium]|nr:helix-turn-helix domain-containing protein [Pseudomonadota bacterium]